MELLQKLKIRILCNNKIDHIPEAKEILASVGKIDYREYNYDELYKCVHYYDVILPSLNVKMDEKLLKKANRLRLIATPSTGTDHIDVAYAANMGIQVISL